MIMTAEYIRVSTEEQALHGYSLDAQREALDKYAKENDLYIVDRYIDDGYTASKLKRPALQRMLDDVRAGKIKLIIFTKLDRWFRNIRDYYKIQEVLEQNNCNWKTVLENYDTTTANGRLHINIMLSVAQDECDRTSERIKAVFESKTAKGEVTTGSHPIGLKIENKRLVEDTETSHIVKAAFDYYNTHHSFRQTMIYLNSTYNIATNHRTLKYMLTNKLYIGEKGDNRDFCKAIIDRDVFDNVQRLLIKNIKSTPSKNVYIFSGLLVCAECGRRMVGSQTKYLDKTYQLYRCDAYTKTKTCPHKKQTNERKLEQYLLDNIEIKINQIITDHELSLKTKAQQKKQSNDKAKIKKKLDKLKELFVNDLISLDEYRKDHEAYQAQLASIVEDQEAPPINIEGLRQLLDSDFKSMYEQLHSEEKRAFWRSIISKIVVDNDGNYRIFFM